MKLILRGVPASQGLAVGRVLRVDEGTAAQAIEKGAPVVLVAAMSSPSLRMLVQGARDRLQVSALVVERGGSLTTMATLARELGVPAVFGVVDALTSIRDGELVLVDGGTGWVYRLDGAGAARGEKALPASPLPESLKLDSQKMGYIA